MKRKIQPVIYAFILWIFALFLLISTFFGFFTLFRAKIYLCLCFFFIIYFGLKQQKENASNID